MTASTSTARLAEAAPRPARPRVPLAAAPVLRLLAFTLPVAIAAFVAMRMLVPDLQATIDSDGSTAIAAAPLIAVLFLAIRVAYFSFLGERVVNGPRTAVIRVGDTSVGEAAKWAPLAAAVVLPVALNTLALALAAAGVGALGLIAVLEFLRRRRPPAAVADLRPDAGAEIARFRWDALAGVAVLAAAFATFVWRDTGRPTEVGAAIGIALPLLALAPYFHPLQLMFADRDTREAGFSWRWVFFPSQLPVAVLAVTGHGWIAFWTGALVAGAIVSGAEAIRRNSA